jgi:hypothetical protein
MSRRLTVAGLVLAGLGSFALSGAPWILDTFRFSLALCGMAALWLSFFLATRRPKSAREFLRALVTYCTTTATLICTAALLLLLLNLALDATLKIASWSNRRLSIEHFSLYGDRVYEPYAGLGLSHQDVERLLIECFQRPVVFESFTQFRERPFDGQFVNVHQAGFRDSGNHAPWPPTRDNVNIFVFGGSTTFGYGVPDTQTIPAHLQRLFDRQGLRRRVLVYNFGAGFYFSTQERILFENQLLEGVRPDIAVFIDGLNEFGHPDGNGYHTGTIRQMMERRVASKDFFLADTGGILENMPVRAPLRRLLNYVTFPGARPASAEGAHPSPPTGQITSVLDRYSANQKIIRNVAAAFGIELVFVWQPVPSYEYDLTHHLFQKGTSLPGSPGQRALESMYGEMAARRTRAPAEPYFLYLADLQKNRQSNLYVDEVHYTPEFNAEIAGSIFDHLERLHVLQ